MKKKTCLAILAMCIALTATACGNDDTTKDKAADAGTEQKADDQDKKDSKEDENKVEEPKDFGTRLVSVDSVDKYVTIGEYKGLTLDNTVQEVTDDEVDYQISAALTDKAEEVTDKNGTVQDGDIVTINFVGTKDGVAFEGGTANNYDLTIGAGGFIEGFEEGIIGMKKGETKDLNLTFPEEYQQEDLAGQDVVFKVTLQNFRRAQELSDAWVAKNTEYTTVDDYRAGMRKELEENARASAESNLKYTAWNTVLNNSEVKEYPQDDVDNAVTEYKRQIQLYAQQGDMEIEDFVEAQGMTMEVFEQQCQQYAESKVKQNLIVQGIMDAEGITLEDEESLKLQDLLIKNYNAKDLADLIDQYGQVAVDEAIGLMRVENFIVENATVDEKVSNGDLVGQSGDGGDASKGVESDVVEEEDETADNTDDTRDDSKDDTKEDGDTSNKAEGESDTPDKAEEE
ncbi:trigger factor [Blautia schinkii]|nr:trigger factor [Blautia schinkii]